MLFSFLWFWRKDDFLFFCWNWQRKISQFLRPRGPLVLPLIDPYVQCKKNLDHFYTGIHTWYFHDFLNYPHMWYFYVSFFKLSSHVGAQLRRITAPCTVAAGKSVLQFWILKKFVFSLEEPVLGDVPFSSKVANSWGNVPLRKVKKKSSLDLQDLLEGGSPCWDLLPLPDRHLGP